MNQDNLNVCLQLISPKSMDFLPTNLAFIGFMGSGKTTVGKILAQKTGVPFVDVDRRIVAKTGMEINSIFNTYGESYFRDIEEETLNEIMAKKHQIVSCGGGIILREANRQLLKRQAINCWLYNSPETALSRIKNSNRPLLNNENPIATAHALLEERTALYHEIAHYKIFTENLSLIQVTDIIYEEIYLPIFG